MVASGVKPDRLAYLVMLNIITRFGETKKLMALYRTMMNDGYVPDDTLYQVMLAALAKGNEHEEIEGVMQDMVVVCQMDRQLVYSVLIKAGCIFQGAMLLKQACLQGHEPDSKSLLSTLDAYETMGKHAKGLSLLQCIREHVPSSHKLISECSIMLLCKNQKIAAALQEYSSMQTLVCGSFGQDCNLYECLITCLEEAEFLPEASQVFCA